MKCIILFLRQYEKNNIIHWKMSDVIECEQYFQISHLAMLCKLRRENIITSSKFKNYKYNIKKEARKLGFDTSLYESTTEYYSLGKIIPLSELAYNENRITGGKYNEILLNVYRGDIVYNLNEEEDILE